MPHEGSYDSRRYGWSIGLHHVWLLAIKDLRSEFRRPYEVISLLTFSLGAVLISSLTLGGGQASPEMVASLIWILLLFLTTLTYTTSFAREADWGTLGGLKSLPCSPLAILGGKVVFGTLLIFLVGFCPPLLHLPVSPPRSGREICRVPPHLCSGNHRALPCGSVRLRAGDVFRREHTPSFIPAHSCQCAHSPPGGAGDDRSPQRSCGGATRPAAAARLFRPDPGSDPPHLYLGAAGMREGQERDPWGYPVPPNILRGSAPYQKGPGQCASS